MNDTAVLLGKISALRQRLQAAQGLVREAGSVASSLLEEEGRANGHLAALEQQVSVGVEHQALVDETLRQVMVETSGPVAPKVRPVQLTARARRALLLGRELLTRLRQLGEQLESAPTSDPLAVYFRESAAMTEAALRLVQAFPDAPSAQLRLCEGLEAMLAMVAQRLEVLDSSLARRQEESRRVDHLADLLHRLFAGQAVDVQPFLKLAESMLVEAEEQFPLHFYRDDCTQPARAIAAHSLNVAAVIARILRHDPHLRGRPVEPVLAALVHEVGMLHVPTEILAQPCPLDDAQRRLIEAHTWIGGDLAMRLLPSGTWLAEATAGHHERLDGTGYPGGLRETQLSSLARLLAVCDVYAALCAPRPYRPACETRTALTDTLLLADQGALDRQHSERLLLISFYPVGSVVELADGTIGLVVAAPLGRRDVQTPARPVVALLVDSQGKLLPSPHHVDLAQSESRGIVRSLPADERREVLGRRYPAWV
jgi:HD-GYP domain-containing protein (c-di-GMP phosphodiesterase class II)